MVAIDVDGTLVTSAKEVTDATAAILRMARKQAGVHVVLATGRPPRSVMDIYRRLSEQKGTVKLVGLQERA
ncbi:hypothetical protein LCGC14_2925750 [marine sediment metagenome]|uniref:Uncharacterized protein n=1 Tax=marine sediment metagenome TaxID=412755 RepID=A0A0F8ZV62_9ZZZZ